MLNGLDPIIIFNFYKKLTSAESAKFANLPIAGFINKFALPPIPIYLSEKATGLFIDSESKNIDIDTTQDTLNSGGSPEFNQKAINSIVKVNMTATRESIGLNILSAIADLILPKVTSQEYSIIYLHGATTIFGGLLHSFSVETDSNTDLLKITIEIAHTSKSTASVIVDNTPTTSLNNTGSVPTSGSGSSAAPIGGGSAPIANP